MPDVTHRGLRRKGRIWYAYTRLHGVWHERSLHTELLSRARALRDAWLAQLRAGVGVPAGDSALTVDALIDLYVEHRAQQMLSWATERYRLRLLSEELGRHHVEDLSAQAIETTVARWREDVATSTSNRRLARWKALLRYGRDTGLVSLEAYRRLTTPKILREDNARLRFLTDAEEEALLYHASSWLRLALVASIDAGLRRGELLRLAWRDVDMVHGTLWLGRTKGGRPRGVPLSERLLVALAEAPRTGDLVMARADGHKPGVALRLAWEELRLASGVLDVRWHDLRHTAASRWAAAGATERDLMDLLGQRSSAMAQRYVHLRPDRLHDLVARASLPSSCHPSTGKPMPKGVVVSFEARSRSRLAR